jgi:hypothetical protein
METIRNRWLMRQLQAALKGLPVVALTGARQTGKTTLAQSLPQKRTFVSRDDRASLARPTPTRIHCSPHLCVFLMTLPMLVSAATPKLPGVEAAMQPAVDACDLAGAVTVVVAKDRVLHCAATGLADVARNEPMRPDALFWVASMTKPVTGFAPETLGFEAGAGCWVQFKGSTDPAGHRLHRFHRFATLEGSELLPRSGASTALHATPSGDLGIAGIETGETCSLILPGGCGISR